MVELVRALEATSMLFQSSSHVFTYSFDFILVFGAFICLCVEGGVLYNNSSDEPSPYWLRYLVIIRPVVLIRYVRACVYVAYSFVLCIIHKIIQVT